MERDSDKRRRLVRRQLDPVKNIGYRFARRPMHTDGEIPCRGSTSMAIHSAPEAPKHLLVDFFGVSPTADADADALLTAMTAAAAAVLNAAPHDLHATLLNDRRARVLILAADGGRLAVTLLPEARTAFFDCLAFSPSANLDALSAHLADFFRPEIIRKTTLTRGFGA
jgi:hypothetical protein